MRGTIEEILSSELETLKTEIISRHEQSGQVASGRTRASFESSVSGTMIAQTVDTQIKTVEEKYANALKNLGDMQEPVQLLGQSDDEFKKEMQKYKEFMLQKAYTEIQIEKQKSEEIKAIQDNRLSRSINEMEKAMQQSYAVDLAKFSDNEREKNRIESQMQKKRSAETLQAIEEEYMTRRGEIIKNAELLASVDGAGASEKTIKAMADLEVEYNRRKNAQIAADNAEARKLASQQNQIQLNSDLLRANENALAKYDAKKTYLEKEAELYKDNADKQLEITQQLAEAERELLESRIQEFQRWSGQTMELLSSVSNLAKANEDAEMQKYEESNTRKKDALKKRLDSGKLSQEQYNKEVAKLDADLDSKKKEIALQQAKREKAIGIMQATINTAMAIAKALSSSAPPVSIVMAALAGALGAVQIATIAAQPLPKASRGILLHGASHAQGGIPIEAEGGEAIINKRSTSMFRPLLSAINQAGGGVKFASGGMVGATPSNFTFANDGGFLARSLENQLTAQEIGNAISEEMKNFKSYVTVEDYRREDENYVQVEGNAVF